MSDANEQLRRFHGWIKGAGDGQYQPALAREVMQVASVAADSNGAIVSVEGGLLQGDGSISSATFTLPMGGRAAAVGDFLLIGRDKTRAVGAELVYLGHTQTLYPGSGLVAINADIPAPTFASPPSTTAIVKLPGSITAKMSVFFNAVPQANPTGYTVSYRIAGGQWRDRHVPHIGGVQECDLGSDLPPSAAVDVHLRTICAWAAQQSPPSADSTFATAADNSTPGSISALSVSVATPGQLSITPTASIDNDLLRGFIYYINGAASGAPAITSVPINGPWDAVVPPGTYYVAAVPIAKSGTLGTRFPAAVNTYQGPYVVLDQSRNLDTTAPSTMGVPTLIADIVQFADNTWHGYLTVTLPAYTPPADINYYEVSIVVDDGRKWIEIIDVGQTSGRFEVGFGGFTIKVRARDIAMNAGTFGSAATVSLPAPVLSNAAPTVTTASIGAGIKISWSAITNALGYEIQRATDGSGTGATTIGTTDARWFVDPLVSATIILPTYYYRARALSMSNQTVVTGTYSGWTAGTAGAVDAQNLRLLSIVAGLIATDAITANKILAGAITASKLEADLILASMIRTASSGTRWEIEGHTGTGAQDQLRFYLTTTLAMMLNGSGINFYGSGGQGDFSLARNGSGRGQLTMGALIVGTDGVGPFVQIPFALPGGGGELRFVGAGALGKLRELSYQGLWSVGYEKLDGTIGSGPIWTFHDNTGGGVGLEKTAIYYNGISSDDAGISPITLLHNRTTWIAYPGLHAGASPAFYGSWPLGAKAAGTLGFTAADVQPLQAWQYATGNIASLTLQGFRGATIGSNDWQEARFRLLANIDNGSALGGGIDLGFKAYLPFFSLHTGGTARLYWDDANTRVLIPNNLRVDGAMSAGTKPFEIPHPEPQKNAAGLRLRHVAIEGPTRGDTLCRFAVLIAEEQVGMEIATPLPDYWRWLNEDAQCWVSPRRNFGRAWAEVGKGGESFILAADRPGWYEVMVVATRTDEAAVAGWDRAGGLEYQASDADRERQHKRRDSLGRKIAPRKAAV